ncbi:NAD-binding protein [Mycena latifolia]|nr:NAD-binding protein [Mycena latifolia]
MVTAQKKIKFFLSGATGYIGGTVLVRFMQHPNASNFEFTLLVRDPKKAEAFRGMGFTAVVGSHADEALLEHLASEADVVIATADCDDLVAANATLRGSKKRFQATGIPQTYINTVGLHLFGCVLIDDAKGMFASDTVYDDTNTVQLETIDPEQPHRNVDLAIIDADKEGYVKSYIIIPSTVYGRATGPFVAAGLQNPTSMQVPQLINASLDRGQGGMVGLGENLWPNVEINELADLYVQLYDVIRKDPNTGHGREGLYFGASDEHHLYDLSGEVAHVLVEMGRGAHHEPTTFSESEVEKYYPGANSRCRANRSYAIGWTPVRRTSDLLASVRLEIESQLQAHGGHPVFPRSP